MSWMPSNASISRKGYLTIEFGREVEKIWAEIWLLDLATQRSSVTIMSQCHRLVEVEARFE